MDQSYLVSMVQAAGAKVCAIFSRHILGLLEATEHHLNVTEDLSTVADHVHLFVTTVFPSSNDYLQQDDMPSHKAKIISNWFHEHDTEFTVLKWTLQSPDRNPIESFWDVVEQEIYIADVQPTILQQLSDAIMSVSCHEELRQL